MFPRCKQTLAILTGILALAAPGAGYYHFVHYNTRSAPFVPIPEKFDLRGFADRTVRYYISQRGPATLAQRDSFESVVSQIRLAAGVWNGVSTSELRIEFGGLYAGESRAGTTPAIDVIFDEMPPGVLALGGPTTRGDMTQDRNGAFVPITRSVVILNRDLSGQPSASEGFSQTVAHELGHAMGLQHTLTSSLMSTSLTRATSKARPLGMDDVAGISLLYPTAAFRANTGSISGRVTMRGEGVALASVVALSPQGPAVSALTNPDGTYRIEGLGAGQYFVCVHPLPPPVYGEVSPANIVLPRDAAGEAMEPAAVFETLFYPGDKSAEAAVTVPVEPGKAATGIDFAVQPRRQLDLYAISMYSFPGNVAVPQAYVVPGGPRQFVVASGFGLSVNSAPAPGLSAAVLGGSAFIPQDGLVPYSPDRRFVQINLEFNPFSGSGSRHLIFTLNNDIHLRPAGLNLTTTPPPFIEDVMRVPDSAGRPAVAIEGRNLSRNSRILFDGVDGVIRNVAENGNLVVLPPPASGNHRATIVALNSDGQSSLFLQAANAAPQWEYDARPPGSFSITPSALPANGEAMVEIRGSDTQFLQGLTELGFGTSDVTVNGLWVISPTHAIANVALARSAEGILPVSLVSGLDVVLQQRVLQVQPANPRLPAVRTPALNAVTGTSGPHPGGTAFVRVSNLAEGIRAANLTLTLDDQPAPVLALEDERLTFAVPGSIAPGPAILRLRAGSNEALPVVVAIEPIPPQVLQVYVQPDRVIEAARPARHGELLNVLVSALGYPGDSIPRDALKVFVAGLEHSIHQVTAVPNRPGFHEVQFFLGTNVPTGGSVELWVVVAGRASERVEIPVVAR